MLIGYARVSTVDQNLDLQIDALTKFGCDKIYKEIVSGAKASRPELDKLISELRPKDTVVIWKLDRLGRSLKHLVELVAYLSSHDIGLKSLQDPIDTSSAQGRLTFNIFASLAEFERELIRERTKAGLTSARARGRVGGKPKGLSDKAKTTSYAAAALYTEGKLSVAEITQQLGITKPTLYSYLRYRNIQFGNGKNKAIVTV